MVEAGVDLGRYRIVAPIGVGGMGEVYRARDMFLRRDVALKVLIADRNEADDRAKFVARMMNEARAAAALAHPNVVSIYDVGEANGNPYIVFELVQGSTLRVYLQDASVTLLTKIRWLRELAVGLAAAHNAGFIHRDVKPTNVMITNQGQVKLLDFGIAKRSPYAGDTVGHATLEGPESFKTRDGSIVGTPRYMAPETLAGMVADGRADQYAWGCIAYELLSMSLPERIAVARMPLGAAVPGLAGDVVATVERALAPLREHRFATMDLIVMALEPFVAGQPSSLPSAPSGERASQAGPLAAPTTLGPTRAAPLLAYAYPHPTVPTSPPPGFSSPPGAYGDARLSLPGPPHPPPPPPAKSSVGAYVVGASVSLGAVILLGAGVFLGARAFDARSPATSSTGAASIPGSSAAATAAVPGAGAGAGATSAGATAAAATAKGARGVAPVSAAAAAPKASAGAAAGNCSCSPTNGPDGQALCKRVSESVDCHCDAPARLCPVAWIRGADKVSVTCPSARNGREYHGALRTGGTCTGFQSGSTGDDNKLLSGKLECNVCATENGRLFNGANGDACRGFHRENGAPFDGKLVDCR